MVSPVAIVEEEHLVVGDARRAVERVRGQRPHNFGVRGVRDVDDRHEPSLVEALWPRRPLRRVNAGSVHTCALGVDGVAYSFGKHESTGHGAAADACLR